MFEKVSVSGCKVVWKNKSETFLETSKSVNKQIRNYYKHDAKNYEKRRFRQGGELVHEAEMTILFDLLKPCSKDLILDIGAGTGRFERMVDKFKSSVVSCDLTREMLKIAKEDSNASLLRADGLRLPFKNNTFNKCVAMRFLFHFSDYEKIQILNEILRVTKEERSICFDLQSSKGLLNLFVPIKDRKINLPIDPKKLEFLLRRIPGIKYRFYFSFLIPRGIYRHLPKKFSQVFLIIEKMFPEKLKKFFCSTIFCLVTS